MSYNISLIGSGTMGMSIAQLFILTKKFQKVHLLVRSNKEDFVKKELENFLNKQLKKNKIDSQHINYYNRNFSNISQ